MTLVYETINRYLRDAKAPSVEGARSASTSALGNDSEDLIIVSLKQSASPDFFVGYSCNVDVTNTYGTFRVFHADNGKYGIAPRSEDYPLLSAPNALGISTDQGNVEVVLLNAGAKSDATHIATVWTQGGARPAVFSIIVWEWDGRLLQPMWTKLGIQRGTVKIVSPLIFLNTISDPGTGQDDNEVFRLDGAKVLSEGRLSSDLLQRYLPDRAESATSNDIVNLAYLWESVGQLERAIPLYEQAMAIDKGSTGFLYLTVADLYERQGHKLSAAKILEAYRRSAKGQLSTVSEHAIQERIKNLRTGKDE
jgi:tetratricopeptide (TPR) repeat protein